MVLGALAALLEIEQDIEVVGRAPDGEAALALANERKPDVVLTDIEMPKMSGLELAVAIRRNGLAARVIILTTFARAGYLRRALEAERADISSRTRRPNNCRMPSGAFIRADGRSIRNSRPMRGASPIR